MLLFLANKDATTFGATFADTTQNSQDMTTEPDRVDATDANTISETSEPGTSDLTETSTISAATEPSLVDMTNANTIPATTQTHDLTIAPSMAAGDATSSSSDRITTESGMFIMCIGFVHKMQMFWLCGLWFPSRYTHIHISFVIIVIK